MDEKTVCIIQTRTASTRLPRKIFANLERDITVLDFVLNQLSHSKHLKKIVIATTTLNEDDEVENFAKHFGLDFFRGSSEDVLDRYYQCAKQFSASNVIRITSDCPLIDPQIVDQVIEKFQSSSYDYVSNTQPSTFPIGIAIEIFKFEALEKAWKNATLPSEREHVTPYIYKHKDQFKIFNFESEKNYSFIRITVDKKNDLEFIRLLISKINKRPILLNDILEITSKEPEMIKINNDTIPLEGYLKSLEKDKEFIKSNFKED